MAPRARIVAIDVGAVLVLVGVPAPWWWTHPTRFPDMHGASSMLPRPVDRAALGTARVDCVDLDYGLGWNRVGQHGTDTVSVDLTSHAR